MKIIPSPCSPLSPVLADSVIARITNSSSESEITIANFALGRRSKAIGCPLHCSSLCLLHPETVDRHAIDTYLSKMFLSFAPILQ